MKKFFSILAFLIGLCYLIPLSFELHFWLFFGKEYYDLTSIQRFVILVLGVICFSTGGILTIGTKTKKTKEGKKQNED